MQSLLEGSKYIRIDFFIMENVKGLINMKHVNPKLNKTELNIFKANCSKLQRFKDLKRYDAQRNLNIKEKYEFLELKSDLKRIKRQINERMVPLIEKILKKIYLMGYKVEKKVLNSADYGVPQTRERIFFIGTKHKEISISFPNVTHLKNPGGNSNKLLPWKTVGDTLKKYEEWEESDEINHIFTSHSIKFIKKIRNTSIGQNIYKNYSDAFWRLDPEKPARTVKENHGGVFVHYKFDRVCTPRELATLQSFDDSFIFQGTKSDILKQIGNAVPPLLSKVLAGKIKKLLSQFNINENKLVPIISYVK